MEQRSSSYLCAMRKNLGNMGALQEGIQIDANSWDDKTRIFFSNMIQGHLLEYLSNWLCHYSQTYDYESKQKMTSALMQLLSNNLFALFRKNIEKKPSVISEVALKLVKQDDNFQKCPNDKYLEKFYVGLIKRYFLSNEFDDLLSWFLSHTEINKIIILHKFKEHVLEQEMVNKFEMILKQFSDEELQVCQRYCRKFKFKRLTDIIENGSLRLEVDFLKNKRT